MAASIIVMIAVIIITKGNVMYTAFSMYILPVFALIMKKKLKKYNPKNLNKTTIA